MNFTDQRRPIQVGNPGLRRVVSRQRQANKTRQFIIWRDIRDEVFFRRPCVVHHVIQFQQIRVDIFPTHFATAHTLTLCATTLHLIVNILPQTGTPVPFDYICGRDITNNTIDTTIARDGRFDIGDEIDQLLGGIRMELAALPVFVQLGIGK